MIRRKKATKLLTPEKAEWLANHLDMTDGWMVWYFSLPSVVEAVGTEHTDKVVAYFAGTLAQDDLREYARILRGENGKLS